MSNLIKLIEDFESKSDQLHEKLVSEEILQLLDLIYIETESILKNHNHQIVLQVLITFIQFDGRLKELIKLKTEHNQDDNSSKKEFFDYLELQAQVNTFRNKLLEVIVHYLCDRYEYARQLGKINIDIATRIFKETKNINDYYVNELIRTFEQETIDSSDYYKQKTCKDTINTLEEVSTIALKSVIRDAEKVK